MELYKDPTRPVEERVEDLLSRMTLEEKAAQLCGDLPGSVFTDGVLNEELLKEKFPNGHGRFTQYSMLGLSDPEIIAKTSNKIQDYFVNHTRLGIPVALQTENLCGYPAAGGTLFPAQINLGCTWEPELAREMSAIIGQESRSVGISSAMSPVIDVSRDPRWGRTYETYGEDPYLISQFGINYVQGMQEQGVSCIAKHFLGYAVTQGGLNTSAANINDRELYEVYATPFEAAMKEADLGSVMANYGEIDGMPVIDNPRIATELLRNTMGFKGILTSDGAAVFRTWATYKMAETYEECGLIAKKAGTDTEIPVGNAFRQLPRYVQSGDLDESVIDDSVRRVLTVKFKMGLFENPYCDVEKLKEAMANDEKKALSREIAAKSLVLLKNDGVLPLAKKTKKIALIGPHADSLRYPVSGYTYPAYIEMLEASLNAKSTTFAGITDEAERLKKEARDAEKEGKKKPDSGFAGSMFSILPESELPKISNMTKVLRDMNAVSLREALEAAGEDVVYVRGCDIVDPSTEGFAEAVQAAESADVVVMAMGGNCGWVNVTGGEGKDRQTLELPGVQQQLLEAVTAAGKPVILVLYGPGVFSVNYAAETSSAILQAFMPGQYAGEVITETLLGDRNPGGKLTMSVPRGVGQIPIFYNHKNGSGFNDTNNMGIAIFSGGYVDGPSDPLFKFGHGLSYTTFDIHDMDIAVREVPTDGMVEISVKVTNTGDREGTEVVQLYTSFFGAHVTRPVMSLQGFCKVSLKAGEEAVVKFHLSTAQLGYYNENMEFVVEPGTLTVMTGSASDNLSCKETIKLTGKKVNVLGKRSYTCSTEIC
ncbi:MAG: glycoside hydrolase family 3 C-terminal domain-containing protein [Lachnospiraceae bacterium]|nr:glycoside hydrolase family 3 C-terminal domain-containing protein [Lachnospiraceae bacterium]